MFVPADPACSEECSKAISMYVDTEMRESMKNKFLFKTVALVLTAGLLAGCSIENTAAGTPQTDKRNTSGAAEDDSIEFAAPNRSYLENSDNRYNTVFNKKTGYTEELVQYRLDGTKVKSFPSDIMMIEGDTEVNWVTDNWIYCVTTVEVEDPVEGYDVLWRIPVRKTEKGDRLLTDRQEKLLKADIIQIDYATDSWLIMEVCQDNSEYDRAVCKYDIRPGKMTELIPEEEDAECLCRKEYPFMWKEGLFYEGYDKLYYLEPENGQVSSLYTFDGGEGIEDEILLGDTLYFLTENGLFQCNCPTRTTECVIPAKRFQKAVRSLKLGDIEEIDLSDFFMERDKFYFSLMVWWGERDRDSKKIHGSEDMLFCVPKNNFQKLEREEKLMNYLEKKNEKRYMSNNNEYFTRGGYIGRCEKGMVVASYPTNRNNFRYVLYDLKTGEIRDMAEDKLPKEYEECAD